jgi:hypothetical protein
MTLSGSKPNLLSTARLANRAIGDDTAYNPREDDKVYLGTRLLDSIENQVIGGVKWWQEQSEDKEGIYDDMFRLIGGGAKNVATAISYIPGVKQIGKAEDWIAAQARSLSTTVAPELDPRYAGWLARFGTGVLTDKGLGVVTKAAKARVLSKIDDFTGLYGGVGTAMDVSGGTVDTIRRWPDGSVAQNPYLRLYKREDAARIGQGLRDAVPPKPSAATKWDAKMDDIYNLLTGRDPDLPTAGVEELQGIPLHTPKSYKGPKFKKHHPAPLAHIARALDYLTDAGVREGADYLAGRMGFNLGDFQPGTLIEDMFHSKMHRLLDDSLGTSKGGLLYKLEKKYFGKRKLSDGISLEERISSGFMDELADVLLEQKGFIEDWYRALVNRAEFKKVSIEEYVNEAAETVKADKVLKSVIAGRRTREKGISDLLDELIGLENKELRDTMKDLQQLSEPEDILLSPESRNLKRQLTFNAKTEFLNEIMNMDWAGTSITDARKKIFKLIDDYDLPFETDKFTPEQLTDQIVESLHNLDIDESLNPVLAKEIKDWLGRE